MNEQELKSIWQSYDKKIDNILEINKQQLNAIQTEKAESKIQSFIKSHVAVMGTGIVWVLFLGFLLYHAHVNIFFTVSLSAIILFNVFAVLLYLRHIITLSQVNIAESITAAQTKLSQVRISYTHAGRVLLLQAPFYCTWWYTEDLVRNGGPLFWIVNLAVLAFFIVLSIYLFTKLSHQNKSNNWVKRVDKSLGAEKLEQASAFLKEIDEFKKEKLS
ncbi:MAG: hypothetical protein SGI89_02925 [bacterium]|nr:hypothetical protein [bacterium]